MQNQPVELSNGNDYMGPFNVEQNNSMSLPISQAIFAVF